MKIKALALGGAALFLMTAAYASQPSSPTERAQTNQLNEQSLQAAQQGHALASQDLASQAGTANDSAAANPAAAPTPQVAANDMTAPVSAPGTRLSDLPSAPAAANTAYVVDNKGDPVGAVRKIETAANGAPLKVDIALAGEQDHVVAIDASHLTYDHFKNVLTARTSAARIRAMPLLPQS